MDDTLHIHYDFYGKDGRHYQVDYFNFPGAPQDEARNNFALPRFAGLAPQLKTFIRNVWPGYKPPTVASTIAKFDKFARFALAYCNGELVAFNIYKVGIVETDVGPAKTIYVEHAGTLREHQGNGVTQAIRNEFYRREKPDIICGSSANGAIYVVNTHIAKTRRMVLYPTGPKTPAPIVELANQIHDSLGLRNAELDDRLVRSYKTPVSKGDMKHPLKDSLPLGPNQHIFYMLLEKNLDQALLRGQMR